MGTVTNDRPGLKWAYKIRNETGQTVQLLEVINRKTCCGVVHAPARMKVAAGETVDLEVEIKASGTLGPLQHFATVTTDSAACPVLQFWTVADVVPRVRVEPIGDHSSALKGQPLDQDFLLTAVDVDPATPIEVTTDGAARGTRIEWSGPTQTITKTNASSSMSRPFRLRVPADREAGAYQERLTVTVDGKFAVGTTTSYAVQPLLTVTPAAVVFKPDRTGITLTFTAADRQPFRVIGATTESAGLSLAPLQSADDGPGVTVKLTDPAAAGRRGSLTIRTDHPRQTLLVVPFYNGAL